MNLHKINFRSNKVVKFYLSFQQDLNMSYASNREAHFVKLNNIVHYCQVKAVHYQEIKLIDRYVKFQFQDGEKKRYKAEQQRHEQKQRKQLDELRMNAEATIKELEQLQVSFFL